MDCSRCERASGSCACAPAPQKALPDAAANGKRGAEAMEVEEGPAKKVGENMLFCANIFALPNSC